MLSVVKLNVTTMAVSVLNNFMLDVSMLIVVFPSVVSRIVILSVIMLNTSQLIVTVLSAIMLGVNMLSVVLLYIVLSC